MSRAAWHLFIAAQKMKTAYEHKNINLRSSVPHGASHTIFGTYLIFFSSDQIAEAENIFSQHGIKKA